MWINQLPIQRALIDFWDDIIELRFRLIELVFLNIKQGDRAVLGEMVALALHPVEKLLFQLRLEGGSFGIVRQIDELVRIFLGVEQLLLG